MSVGSIACSRPLAASRTEGEIDRSGSPPASEVRDGTLRSGDDPPRSCRSLLEVAENTCYLHAALRRRLPSRIVATLNGESLPPR